jgi:Arc/MetJ-type ribon-helix-helix transcriptional regulator
MPLVKERVTISVDPKALEDARAEVESGAAADLSTAIEAALMTVRRDEALRDALRLWEEEFGPIGQEEKEWARREFERVSREPLSSTPER